MTRSEYDYCDYCSDDFENGRGFLLPVGFTDFEGATAPLVKMWCGKCEADDEIDLEARQAVLNAVKKRRG